MKGQWKGTPVRILLQPRWWLRLQLDLEPQAGGAGAPRAACEIPVRKQAPMTLTWPGIRRFLRYNLVGAMGLAVKVSVLSSLVELAGQAKRAPRAIID